MISLIIPTIWAYEPFPEFLQYIADLPIIGEVILINNRVEQTPDHPVLQHPKIKHHKMPQNIYVNPAWNLGVQLAENDKVCIMNDDITVDLKAFFAANKFVSKEIGLLCIGTNTEVYNLHRERFDEIKNLSRLSVTGNLQIKPFGRSDICGQGTLFFFHKDNWIPIPDEFKVNFGDTWELEIQRKHGRENYYINDCFYYTPYSVSIMSGVAREYQSSVECMKHENYDYFYKSVTEYIP